VTGLHAFLKNAITMPLASNEALCLYSCAAVWLRTVSFNPKAWVDSLTKAITETSMSMDRTGRKARWSR